MGAPGSLSQVPVVLFDGVCNLCNGAVQFIISRDPHAVYRFASLQSDRAKELLRPYNYHFDRPETILLIDDNKLYTRSDAVLRIARRLHSPVRFFYPFRFLPRFIRDGAYLLIARNRYRLFGKKETCMLPPPDLKSRFLD